MLPSVNPVVTREAIYPLVFWIRYPKRPVEEAGTTRERPRSESINQLLLEVGDITTESVEE
jgi:hypothetical protein